MRRILKQALANAVRWKMHARNPAGDVDPRKVERRKMTALDVAETARLLDHFRGARMFVPVVLAVHAVPCGLRRGEVTALRWGSVDLPANGRWSASASAVSASSRWSTSAGVVSMALAWISATIASAVFGHSQTLGDLSERPAPNEGKRLPACA
jgi:hypothetical protein